MKISTVANHFRIHKNDRSSHQETTKSVIKSLLYTCQFSSCVYNSIRYTEDRYKKMKLNRYKERLSDFIQTNSEKIKICSCFEIKMPSRTWQWGSMLFIIDEMSSNNYKMGSILHKLNIRTKFLFLKIN